MKFNPKQIILAREARDMTQLALSKKLNGIDQGNLSRIERGLLTPSDNTIVAIASILEFPVSFFFLEDVRPAIGSLYYRKQYKLSGFALKKLRAIISILTRAIGKMMEEVELNKQFELMRFDLDGTWTPKTAARASREILGVPRGPISNLTEYIEKAGIIVFPIRFLYEGFDGIAAITDNGWPIIFINSEKPNDRKRMNIAHEKGHVGMHIPFVVDPARDEEAEAFEFANEFLMPSHEIRNDLLDLSYNRLADLKEYWNVSKHAIIRRAYNLDLINHGTYTYLNVELSRRGERINETGFVELDKPKLLPKIIELYTQQGYDLNYLAEYTSLTSNEFNKYFGINNEVRIKKLRPAM